MHNLWFRAQNIGCPKRLNSLVLYNTRLLITISFFLYSLDCKFLLSRSMRVGDALYIPSHLEFELRTQTSESFSTNCILQ